MVKTASNVAPILVTVGGAMAVSRALAAGILLVIFAAGMYYAFGYGVFAMFLIAFVGAARLFVRCGKTGHAQGAFADHFSRNRRSSDIGPAPWITITSSRKVHITR